MGGRNSITLNCMCVESRGSTPSYPVSHPCVLYRNIVRAQQRCKSVKRIQQIQVEVAAGGFHGQKKKSRTLNFRNKGSIVEALEDYMDEKEIKNVFNNS